jgi:hypothetical protein
MSPPTIDDVRITASEAAFGRPIVQNNLRALVVEVIVGHALTPCWRWCSEDWYGWDFVHEDGARLEVKQSAARQSWVAPKNSRPKPRFDIRERTGFYDGAIWYEKTGRHANIYIFAYHPIIDDRADHRDARQWRFYVTATTQLPNTKSIGLSAVRALSPELEWGDLRHAVERERELRAPIAPD